MPSSSKLLPARTPGDVTCGGTICPGGALPEGPRKKTRGEADRGHRARNPRRMQTHASRPASPRVLGTIRTPRFRHKASKKHALGRRHDRDQKTPGAHRTPKERGSANRQARGPASYLESPLCSSGASRYRGLRPRTRTVTDTLADRYLPVRREGIPACN